MGILKSILRRADPVRHFIYREKLRNFGVVQRCTALSYTINIAPSPDGRWVAPSPFIAAKIAQHNATLENALPAQRKNYQGLPHLSLADRFRLWREAGREHLDFNTLSNYNHKLEEHIAQQAPGVLETSLPEIESVRSDSPEDVQDAPAPPQVLNPHQKPVVLSRWEQYRIGKRFNSKPTVIERAPQPPGAAPIDEQRYAKPQFLPYGSVLGRAAQERAHHDVEEGFGAYVEDDGARMSAARSHARVVAGDEFPLLERVSQPSRPLVSQPVVIVHEDAPVASSSGNDKEALLQKLQAALGEHDVRARAVKQAKYAIRQAAKAEFNAYQQNLGPAFNPYLALVNLDHLIWQHRVQLTTAYEAGDRARYNEELAHLEWALAAYKLAVGAAFKESIVIEQQHDFVYLYERAFAKLSDVHLKEQAVEKIGKITQTLRTVSLEHVTNFVGQCDSEQIRGLYQKSREWVDNYKETLLPALEARQEIEKQKNEHVYTPYSASAIALRRDIAIAQAAYTYYRTALDFFEDVQAEAQERF